MTDPTGTSLVLTDAEGNTTTFAYDRLNRLITTTNALSGMTVISYDALGNRLSLTDANTHTTSYTYDHLNRLIQTTDANSLTTVIGYDGLGNRLSLTNGADETTTFGYDEANRLVLSRDPLDNETQYRYDGLGNRVAMIDAEEVETRYQYDPLNRLASVIENYQDGNYNPAFPDQDVKTTYTYDAVGNRLSVTDANTHTTSYSYDWLNRQVEVRDPLSRTVRYGYDAVGNRTVITDAREVVTTLTYDKVNRPVGIDYADSTPDVSFSYDQVGNRRSMSDGSGTTQYTYDKLYRLATVQNGAGQVITYTYDAVGNRTGLVYPEGQTVGYTYDNGNRLKAVTGWQSGQFGYTYDEANRLTGLSLPNGIESSYTYDQAGRLTVLAHRTLTDTLASYAYSLDKVGNRGSVTETLLVPEGVPVGAYLESEELVVMEAEKAAQVMTGTTHAWQLSTSQSGYTGTAYLQGLPDTDALYQTAAITASPAARYPIDFTTPGTYTVWLRGYPSNAAGDSAYLGLAGQVITVSGVAPAQWSWAKGQAAELVVPQSGLYTLTLWLREDGLRVDRLLLTTDTTYLPTGFGPVESVQQTGQMTGALTTLARTINYSYDDLYRLTSASYTSGEQYQYTYDPAGNRLQQIINGDTTTYLYDAANRLTSVDGVGYTFDDNGNLLTTGVQTNTWDAANRLIETTRAETTLQPSYDGLGNRVGQTAGLSTTTFALDVQGLPEVISTSAGNAYLHLPGVIMTENATGTARYLLSDGLGSVRQAVDENAIVMSYKEFDPYGKPVADGGEPYGFTGEWWEAEVGLLYLRARWYRPETGSFLSRDLVAEEPAYLYVRGNPVNGGDPSGMFPPLPSRPNDPPVIVDINTSANLSNWATDPCADWPAASSSLLSSIFNKSLCLRAYAGDEEAMEQIFKWIARGDQAMGWGEASTALHHFLDGDGSPLFFASQWLLANPIDYNYYVRLRDELKLKAYLHGPWPPYYYIHKDSAHLTEFDGSGFGINSPFPTPRNEKSLYGYGKLYPPDDQQLVLGARTLNVDFFPNVSYVSLSQECEQVYVADWYVFEYFDFRKDNLASNFVGTFNIPGLDSTIPTQWLDQLVISGKAKEFWAIVAWREIYKKQGHDLILMQSRDYTGPFPGLPTPGFLRLLNAP